MPPIRHAVAKVEIYFWSARAGLMDRRTTWCFIFAGVVRGEVIDYAHADRQSDAWEIIFSWESSQASAGMWNEWDSHLYADNFEC
jgi:hypothetical protein